MKKIATTRYLLRATSNLRGDLSAPATRALPPCASQLQTTASSSEFTIPVPQSYRVEPRATAIRGREWCHALGTRTSGLRKGARDTDLHVVAVCSGVLSTQPTMPTSRLCPPQHHVALRRSAVIS